MTIASIPETIESVESKVQLDASERVRAEMGLAGFFANAEAKQLRISEKAKRLASNEAHEFFHAAARPFPGGADEALGRVPPAGWSGAKKLITLTAALCEKFELTEFTKGDWFPHRVGEIIARYGQKGWEETQKAFALPDEWLCVPILQKYYLHYCCNLAEEHVVDVLRSSPAQTPAMSKEKTDDFMWCCSHLNQFGVEGIFAQDWVHARGQKNIAMLLTLPSTELKEAIRPILDILCSRRVLSEEMGAPEPNFLNSVVDPEYLLFRARVSPGAFDEFALIANFGLDPAEVRKQILESALFTKGYDEIDLYAPDGNFIETIKFTNAEALEARRRVLNLLDKCEAAAAS